MRSLGFFLFLVSFSAAAQTDPINIHLKSGKIIATRYVYLYSGYDSHLRIHEKNGENISIGMVDHIEGFDENENYRYFKPIQWGNLVWAERGFTSDRIIIYHTDIVTGTMAVKYKPKNCLYSKDESPLRHLKLKYLKRDLADCPASLEYLGKGKKIGAAQVGISIVGYSLITAGMVTLINAPSNEDTEDHSVPEIPPTILMGGIAVLIPVFMTNLKRQKYQDALKVYESMSFP